MKILHVVTQMEAGGAQRVAYLLHQEMLKRGHDSSLLFLYVKRPAYAGMTGVSALLAHPPGFAASLRIASRLFSLIRRERPDVVVTHTHYSNIGGQLIAALSGVRCRIAVDHSVEALYPPLVRWIDRFFGTVGIYSRIVAVSQSVVDALRNHSDRYRRRLHLIRNGASVVPPSQPTDLIRRRWSLPQNKPLLVTVGRMSASKNQALLIRLLPSLPDCHLALLGDGEERTALEALAQQLGVEERVHFLGEQPPEDVHSIVASSDVFLFPSLLEAMPMALMEAMLLARPIISSDIAACRSLLGGAGISVSPQDQAAWLAAIQFTLSDSERALAQGKAAMQQTKAATAERMAREYLVLIKQATRSVPAHGTARHTACERDEKALDAALTLDSRGGIGRSK